MDKKHQLLSKEQIAEMMKPKKRKIPQQLKLPQKMKRRRKARWC